MLEDEEASGKAVDVTNLKVPPITMSAALAEVSRGRVFHFSFSFLCLPLQIAKKISTLAISTYRWFRSLKDLG